MKRFLLAITLIATALGAAYAWKPQFAGHRGSYRGVMNTAEAYRNGVDFYHYGGLECDVRVTKDGYYVILHDNTTGTVCPDADIDAQQNTLETLKALDFKQTRGGVEYTGKICTVAEYLDICVEKGAFPIIELKWTTGINTNDMSKYKGLLDLVTEKGLRHKAIFLTSMSESIKHIRTNYPDVTCQYLLSSDSDAKFEFCKTYGVNPSFQASALTQAIVNRYRQAGMDVAVWTVNSEADYLKYAKMGCFMMTCDYLRPNDMPEIDYPEIPEAKPEPVKLDATVLWERSANAANLPDDFPSKAGTTYTTGQQAAMIGGTFYVNDYGTRSMLVFDKNSTAPIVLPYSEVSLGGSAVHGVTTDDADNIVLRFEASFGPTPAKVRIFPADGGDPVDVDFTIAKGGQHNFVYASGNLLSDDGGYLYFLPNGQNTVSIIKIVAGEYVETIEHPNLSLTGSTASVILPIDNNPDHYIYMVRANGFYRYDHGDKGSLITGSSTSAPNRNSSLGGAYMVIGGHELLAHPSGTNYNGGFTIKDLTSDNAVLATFPALGTVGYGVNASTGTFMRPVKVADDVYHLHCFTMGNGYGVYEIAAKGCGGVGAPALAKPGRMTVFPNPVISSAAVSADTALGTLTLYSLAGAAVQTYTCGDATSIKLDFSNVAAGTYILAGTGLKPVKVIKL